MANSCCEKPKKTKINKSKNKTKAKKKNKQKRKNILGILRGSSCSVAFHR